MSIRRALGFALAGVGVTALSNRLLAARADPLDPALEGAHHTFRWRGIDAEYAEVGDPTDPTLVCLHGINAAASGGEFRAVFGPLADQYHVIAPDLPGFGRSDRPGIAYSAALYEEFLAAFLSEFDTPSVLASSLTAAYAVEAARETPVDRFVLVCPTAIAGPDPPKTWLRDLLRTPIVGQGLFNLLTSRPAIRHFNADHGYYDTGHVTDEWMDYEWQTAHQRNARFAPASFVSGHLNSAVDLADSIRDSAVPTTLVWGREADITPLRAGRALADEADARLVVFDDATLLPHVEYPDQFVDTVRAALEE